MNRQAVVKMRAMVTHALDRMDDELVPAYRLARDWSTGIRSAGGGGGGRHATGLPSDPTGDAVAAGGSTLSARLADRVAKLVAAAQEVERALDAVDVHRKALIEPSDEERADLHDRNLRRGFCGVDCGNWCSGKEEADRLRHTPLLNGDEGLDICPPCYMSLRRYIAQLHQAGLEISTPALKEWAKRRRTRTERVDSTKG